MLWHLGARDYVEISGGASFREMTSFVVHLWQLGSNGLCLSELRNFILIKVVLFCHRDTKGLPNFLPFYQGSCHAKQSLQARGYGKLLKCLRSHERQRRGKVSPWPWLVGGAFLSRSLMDIALPQKYETKARHHKSKTSFLKRKQLCIHYRSWQI